MKSFKKIGKIAIKTTLIIFLSISPLIAKTYSQNPQKQTIIYENKEYSPLGLFTKGMRHTDNRVPKTSFEVAQVLIKHGEHEKAYNILQSVYRRIRNTKRFIEKQFTELDKEILETYAETSEYLGEKYEKEGDFRKARTYWNSAKWIHVNLENWEDATRCTIRESECYR